MIPSTPVASSVRPESTSRCKTSADKGRLQGITSLWDLGIMLGIRDRTGEVLLNAGAAVRNREGQRLQLGMGGAAGGAGERNDLKRRMRGDQ